jgi:Mce-associated membrane protein
VEGQPPANKQDRYQAELTREGDVWKISGLGTVPVG